MTEDEMEKKATDHPDWYVAEIYKDGKLYFVKEFGYVPLTAYGFLTKSAAIKEAYLQGFTHACGEGCYWKGIKRIPERFRN